MTHDEIIEMAKQAGFKHPNPHDGYMGLAYDRREGTDTGPSLEAFAKLVEDKTRRDLREEIVYTWVPPHFVTLAVEEEREECAKVCENVYTGEEACGDWPTPEMCANAIRARAQADRGEA